MFDFHYLLNILTILGSLSLFLFGMKYMSESLLKLSGSKLRGILSDLTSNIFKGVFTGTLITSIIQFSSASVIMTIGFVNSNMLSLRRAIPLIMGANIGTTLKAWLFVYFGLKFNFGEFALPMMGISFPLLFIKNGKYKSYGETIIGLGLIFIALELIKLGLPDVNNHPEWLAWLSQGSEYGFLSILLYIFIGFAATVILQSSSAMFALTMILCSQGWISFEMAAAMVVGENIGTTIMPNIAAIISNNEAKRIARFHLLFNAFGAAWYLILYIPVNLLIVLVTTKATHLSPLISKESIPFALALLHTTFNLLNTLILVGFIPQIEKFLQRFFNKSSKDSSSLNYLDDSISSTSELSMLNAYKQIAEFGKKMNEMYQLIPELMKERDEELYKSILEKAKQYHLYSNDKSKEINNFLTKIASKNLSSESIVQIKIMLDILEQLSNISDNNIKIINIIDQKNKQNLWFTQELRDNLNTLLAKISKCLDIMLINLNNDYENVDIKSANKEEEQLNELWNRFRLEYLQQLSTSEYPSENGIIYNQLLSFLEKQGDCIFEISKSMVLSKSESTQR